MVADTVGNRVELFAPGTNAMTGQWTATGGRKPSLYKPTGIGIDPRGTVYVADQGNERMRGCGATAPISPSWAARRPRRRAAERRGRGGGGAGLGADFYVADTGHNRVLAYGPDGSLLARWGAGGGNGAPGSGPGSFDHPAGVAVSSVAPNEEVIYVADPPTTASSSSTPTGACWGLGRARRRARAASTRRRASAVDGAGDVYALDGENNRVQEFTPEGRFLRKWGYRGTNLGDLSQPTAIAIDCAGDVYVADTNNNRVERFNGRPGAERLPAARLLAAAARRRAEAARKPAAGSRGARAARRRAQRQLRTRCKILATARRGGGGARARGARYGSWRALAAAARQAGHVRLRVGSTDCAGCTRARSPARHDGASVQVVAAGPTGRRTTTTRALRR